MAKDNPTSSKHPAIIASNTLFEVRSMVDVLLKATMFDVEPFEHEFISMLSEKLTKVANFVDDQGPPVLKEGGAK